jgi:signal transduction histidine kinase
LLLTVPVAFRRDYPLAAMAVIGFGALFNWLVIGHYVRCGAALPAAALIAFSVGSRRKWRPALIGAAFVILNAESQAHSDPQLKGFSLGAVMFALVFVAAGRLVRSRERTVARLRTQTNELRAQRDRTARLAVEADRLRVGQEMDGMLGRRIGKLTADAAGARAALGGSPEGARRRLATIEREARETLGDMREIVGTLRDQPATAPQPTLADLDGLLARCPHLTLTVAGERRPLAAGLELTVYRVVERLLETLDDVPGAGAYVTLRYAPDTLELAVRGRVRSGADLAATIAAAREWVALHAGSLQTRADGPLTQTEVRLPLISAHV